MNARRSACSICEALKYVTPSWRIYFCSTIVLSTLCMGLGGPYYPEHRDAAPTDISGSFTLFFCGAGKLRSLTSSSTPLHVRRRTVLRRLTYTTATPPSFPRENVVVTSQIEASHPDKSRKLSRIRIYVPPSQIGCIALDYALPSLHEWRGRRPRRHASELKTGCVQCELDNLH